MYLSSILRSWYNSEPLKLFAPFKTLIKSRTLWFEDAADRFAEWKECRVFSGQTTMVLFTPSPLQGFRIIRGQVLLGMDQIENGLMEVFRTDNTVRQNCNLFTSCSNHISSKYKHHFTGLIWKCYSVLHWFWHQRDLLF